MNTLISEVDKAELTRMAISGLNKFMVEIEEAHKKEVQELTEVIHRKSKQQA